MLPAQQLPWDDEQIYQRLGLTQEQTAEIREIAGREEKVIREAQAELNVIRAQLEKLLLKPAPDMREVERLLQSSLEWKLRSEMAGIRRRVEIRALVGEDRWEDLLRARRAGRPRGDERQPPRPPR